jgi:rubrerythrin
MDVTSRRISNALRTAIRREERTAQAYSEKAREAKQAQVKKVLEMLAKQETGHAKKLTAILNKGLDLSHLGKSEKARANGLHVINDDVRNIERSTGVVSALRRAIQAEESSANFYRSLEKIFRGAEVEILFSKLAEEEDIHKGRLEALLSKV